MDGISDCGRCGPELTAQAAAAAVKVGRRKRITEAEKKAHHVVLFHFPLPSGMASPEPPAPAPSDDAAPPPSSPRNLAAFLAANAQAAASGPPRTTSSTAAPALRAAVLACMDARLHLEALLGVAPGDCHFIRNGGGRVTPDALLSLVASQQARSRANAPPTRAQMRRRRDRARRRGFVHGATWRPGC